MVFEPNWICDEGWLVLVYFNTFECCNIVECGVSEVIPVATGPSRMLEAKSTTLAGEIFVLSTG